MPNLETLPEWLKSKGFFVTIQFDSVVYRFDRAGVNSGWAVGQELKIGEKSFYKVTIGDWKTGEEHAWESDQAEFSEAERKQIKTLSEETRKIKQKEKEERWEKAALEAQTIWSNAYKVGSTPYLIKKGLKSLFGCGIEADSTGNLLVPLKDCDGKLWNLQTIWPEKLSAGDKFFLPGARIDGLFHTIGQIFPEGRIIICEGFATGASIHNSTEHAVVVAFNAGNLAAVARSIRQAYPKASLTVACDNDQWTRRPDGTLYNPGLEKGRAAAKLCGGNAVSPQFANLSTRPTDFNDLEQLEGSKTVREQITNPPVRRELESLGEISSNGKFIRPTESRCAKYLLEYFEDDLVTQDGELFQYVGTHWQMLGPGPLGAIKRQLNLLSGGGLTARQIESAFDHLLLECRVSPANLFQPSPFFANFRNGTLAIDKTAGEYKSEFKPHERSDYLTSVVPLDYEPDKGAVNEVFLESLNKLFNSSDDRDGKIQSTREMFGACLAPLFPRIFFLVGKPGSGKSTLILLASRLVSETNISRVEPHEFRGFQMESMVGKLVNYSTDIKTNEPIDVAMLKKIEDRIPVRIDRKFKIPIQAWLPAVHIFGCNNLPPNYDGDSRAFTRRTTILGFGDFEAEGNFNKNFANECFDANPQGMLNFALEGLSSLLKARGHFSNPPSGVLKLEAWQMRHDPVGQFLQDFRDGEVIGGQTKLGTGADGKIKRSDFWTAFVEWHKETQNKPPFIGRTTFFEKCAQKSVQSSIRNGIWYVTLHWISESNASKM